MKIVVLDGHTLNPGDLSWGGLERLGECTIYDRSTTEETLPRAEGAEIILINKTSLNRRQIAALSDLKYIGVLATGYNVVDTKAARDHNIPVTNIPAYGTDSVAQMAMAHMLNLTQHAAHHAQTVRDGRWAQNPDFCYWDMPLIELDGLTLGIVGIGRIGRTLARMAQAFGMRVIAYDIQPPAAMPSGVERARLDDLLRESDVISLHCPLTPENEGLINAERISMMKKTALLINTSRGPLVDDAALSDALNQGRIAGAGLDVLSREPPDETNPLLTAKNCYITPHIAWATRSARKRLMDMAVENVRAFLAGSPKNVVNGIASPK